MELHLDYTQCSPPDDLPAFYQAFIGHELLNQLVAAQAFARMVLEDEADRLGEESRMLLTRLADLARRADEQARRVADLGRLLREPAGGPSVAIEPLLAEAAAEAKALSRRDDIRYHVLPTEVSAAVSPRLFYQVLRELTDNATRAVPATRPGAVELSAVAAPGGCAVTVRDDGVGLGGDDRPALLEPFAAGRRPGATRPGLGFFLVRHAVGRWGGRLGVRSGLGTAVTLFVPSGEAR